MIRTTTLALTSALAAALATFTLASPASAQAIEEKNLESGKEQLDPSLGYIYITGPGRQAGRFFRVPNEADYEKYREDRAAALAEAIVEYQKDLERWERRAATAREEKREIPEKPVEPTEETFSIGAIELRNMVGFGPEYIFAKGDGPTGHAYLAQVQPGDYVYYGPVGFDDQNGMMGTCYCMGTVSFSVPAGQITVVGNYLTAAPRVPDSWPKTAFPEKFSISGFWAGIPIETEYTQSEPDFSTPASLSALPAVPAEFRAYGKLNNFYGVAISRMPPIPGVLDYRRDEVVDVQAEQAAMLAAEAAVSEVIAQAEAEAAADAEAEAALDEAPEPSDD